MRISDWSSDVCSSDLGDGFREAMRRAVTGVTIITTYHEGRPWGMTVSAFAPVCMKPPTLLVCVNEATVTAEHIQRDRRFCVNLLSERQIAVSQLCSRGNAPKFIDEAFLERTALPGGVIMPVLRESIASFECRAATLTPSGPHLIVIGAIEATIASPTLEPLLYGQCRYLQGVDIEPAFAGDGS